MSFKCKIGLHSWDGCKCSDCGKIRDEQHDWSKDCEKCSKCAKKRNDQHVWNGCKCTKCNETRNEQHDWSKDCEECSKCGKTRDEQHDWSKDCEKCSKCAKKRNDQHVWNGCKCTKCDESRNEQHDWSKDCEECSKCGKTRINQHLLNGCKCTLCGKEKHNWQADSEGCTRCDKMNEIATLADLQAMDKDFDAHYCLIADIDASETINWNDGKGFKPIRMFYGILNGNNFTIRNLFINSPENRIGLFESNYGILRNVVLLDVDIKGGSFVGSRVGSNYKSTSTMLTPTILKCSASGKVKGKDFVGGLVGFNGDNCNIIECNSSIEVTGSLHVGGLVGENGRNSLITGCCSSSEVWGYKSAAGGLVGTNERAYIKECYSSGKVVGIGFVGGLVGWNQKGSITDCNSSSEVKGTEAAGGLVGAYTNDSFVNSDLSIIKNCYSSGDVSGGRHVGGLIGWNSNNSIVLKSFWDIQKLGQPTSLGGGIGKTSQEMHYKSTYEDWDFFNTWQIEEGKAYPTLRCLQTIPVINLKMDKPQGLIRYALLVTSLPDKPTDPQMYSFLFDLLPELNKQPDDIATFGFLWETKPMNLIDMQALATSAFGDEIVNVNKYIYRTLHVKLPTGEAKCFVVHDVDSK